MKYRNAYAVYLLTEGLFSLFFSIIVTVNLVYQVEVVKLNPLQLVLVGTMLEVTSFVSQVPTGVLADVFSRRWSVILGIFLTGAGYVLGGSVPRFEIILLSQLGWGIGSSLIAGAQEAWLADEVGDEHIGRAFMRGSQVGLVGSLVGAGVSVALASVRLNLAIIVGGALLMALSILLIFVMPESNRQHAVERPTWKGMAETFTTGIRLVRVNPLLLTIVAIPLFAGLASEGFDRLWTAHIIQDITLPTLGPLNPVTWFAVISGGATILGILVVELVRRNFKDERLAPRLLLLLSGLQIVGGIGFALAGNLALALGSYWLCAVLRTVIVPIYSAWLTKNSEVKARATIISMSGQLDAIGQIAGGPAIGVLGTLVSIRAALLATSALLTPVLLLCLRAMRLSDGLVNRDPRAGL